MERNTHHLLPKVRKITTKNIDKLLCLSNCIIIWSVWKGSWTHKSNLRTLWWFCKLQLIGNRNATRAIFKTYYQILENNQRIWVLKDTFLSAVPSKQQAHHQKAFPRLTLLKLRLLFFKILASKNIIYLVFHDMPTILCIVNAFFLSKSMFLPANTFAEQGTC